MSTAGAVCAENATPRKTLTQNEKRISSTTASPETISQLPIPTKFIPLLPSGEKLGLVVRAEDILSQPQPLPDHCLAYGADPNQFVEPRLPHTNEPRPVLLNI